MEPQPKPTSCGFDVRYKMKFALITFLAIFANLTMAQDPYQYPLVNGRYQMTADWSIELKTEYRKRIEDGDLVIWRPGITNWIAVWGIKEGETKESTLAWIKETSNPEAVKAFEREKAGYLAWAYLLHEKTEEDERWALYGFMISESGQVQMATYFDDKSDLNTAIDLWMSLEETNPANKAFQSTRTSRAD